MESLESHKPQRVNSTESDTIRLNPEQIEEIHADEYSLLLFYATRMRPLSIEDIQEKLPEPEPGMAQSTMDRLIQVELVEQDSEGRYVTLFPNKYVNMTDYRYDALLETRKDRAIFDIMKDHIGDKVFWSDQAYFSIDYFFTDEQNLELKKMLDEARDKAKAFALENKGKDPGEMKFRRMKYYNMTLSALIASMMLFFTAMMGSTALAHGGGGNDPTAMRMSYTGPQDQMAMGTPRFFKASDSRTKGSDTFGGGGADPTEMEKLQILAQSICDNHAVQDQVLADMCSSAAMSTTDSELRYQSLEILLHHYIQ